MHPPDVYSPPQHVVSAHAALVAKEAILAAIWRRFMHDLASELLRISLLRDSVNKEALGSIVGGANDWGRFIKSWRTTVASNANISEAPQF
jgi:hypothetical protein